MQLDFQGSNYLTYGLSQFERIGSHAINITLKKQQELYVEK